jgi:hypothetical protein
MNTKPDDLTVKDVLDLKSQQMLAVNPEYQRGAVWTLAQKKKLVDSVLRGYPIPLIYFHHIRQSAGKLTSERFEVIDGQQRINALAEYAEGAFKLFDPKQDAADARFPDFITQQPCPWGRKAFQDLPADLKTKFMATPLRVVQIETHNPSEARDLFVRLQAGMPLNSQEKRDAWPGQFTDFILRLGGKPGLSRYPGHDFFNVIMRAQKVQDRGKFRQLAAQIAILYFSRRAGREGGLPDINAAAIDDFYYENLGFDSSSVDAQRLFEIFDKLAQLLRDQKRPKVLGHEAIHLVLLVDTLFDDYTRSWETGFGKAFDEFRKNFAEAKLTQYDDKPAEPWLRYGVYTRVNSDRGASVQRRHEYFSARMRESLNPTMKDPKRLFGALERELIYYRDGKRCAVCTAEVVWGEVDIHHIDEHSKGGKTDPENGVLVHSHCHPKGSAATEFARSWNARLKKRQESAAEVPNGAVADEIAGDEDD